MGFPFLLSAPLHPSIAVCDAISAMALYAYPHKLRGSQVFHIL